VKLLLDTHAFIWWDSSPEKLPQTVLEHLEAPTHVILLSLVSVWEMQIKIQLRKLRLAQTLEHMVKSQSENNGISILPIGLEHILTLERLLPHHRDPFDRLLISQAMTEEATLVTRDDAFAAYGIDLLW